MKVLKPWQEVVGWLVSVEEDDKVIRVVLSWTELVYPADSKEAEVLRQLKGKEGELVSILATDIEDKPILFLIETEKSNKRLQAFRERFRLPSIFRSR